MMKGQRLTAICHCFAKTLLAIIQGPHSGTEVELMSAFPSCSDNELVKLFLKLKLILSSLLSESVLWAKMFFFLFSFIFKP